MWLQKRIPRGLCFPAHCSLNRGAYHNGGLPNGKGGRLLQVVRVTGF
jgi:hypothetical protein